MATVLKRFKEVARWVITSEPRPFPTSYKKEKEGKTLKKQEKFLMRIDNNKEGRNLIHSMKRNLNSNSYRIVTKYSGPRPAGTNQHSTSRENANSIRVYVESKLPETFAWKAAIVEGTPELRANQIRLTDSLEQELVKEKKENKVLKAKLTLLTTGLQNSSKYGTFVQTINSIEALI